MFKKVLLFCFCAIIIAGIIPFGVSYWSEDILIKGSITMPEEKGIMFLPEIGGANSNYKDSGTEGEKSPLVKEDSADESQKPLGSILEANDANLDGDKSTAENTSGQVKDPTSASGTVAESNPSPDSSSSSFNSKSSSASAGDSSAGGHVGSAETSATSSSGESSTSGAAGDE